MEPKQGNNPHSSRTVQLPLSNNTWAALQAPFPLNQASWDQMMKILNAMKPSLVTPETPIPEDES